jgi:NAD(P)-dependent dehydrogenase (short-subunit alcohol dehydrogenase family)
MKNIIVTGANSGIGKISAIELAKQGHQLILLMRDSKKSEEVFNEIKNINSTSQFFPTDLSSFKSINKSIEQIKEKFNTIEVILNNAGVYKSKRELNENGIEITFMVNFLAPIYIFLKSEQLLINAASQNKNPRIVNVASALHKQGKFQIDDYNCEKKFSGHQQYSNTKLYLVMITLILAQKYKDISFFANHPGIIATGIFREVPAIVQSIFDWILTSPQKGAESNIFLSSTDELNGKSGIYFDKLKISKTNPIATNETYQTKLYDLSLKILKDYL